MDTEIQSEGAPRFHARRISAAVVPLLLVLVFTGALAARYRPEIYPFANWGMFAHVPARAEAYSLRIHAINGAPLAPPQWVHQVPALREAFARKEALLQVDRTWRAQKAGVANELAAQQRKLEAYFGGLKVAYEPAVINCDPLAFLRTGETKKVTAFGVLGAAP